MPGALFAWSDVATLGPQAARSPGFLKGMPWTMRQKQERCRTCRYAGEGSEQIMTLPSLLLWSACDCCSQPDGKELLRQTQLLPMSGSFLGLSLLSLLTWRGKCDIRDLSRELGSGEGTAREVMHLEQILAPVLFVTKNAIATLYGRGSSAGAAQLASSKTSFCGAPWSCGMEWCFWKPSLKKVELY